MKPEIEAEARQEIATLKAKLATAQAVLRNFEIRKPDADGHVWLIMHGNGTTGQGALNLGAASRFVTKVAACLEEDRIRALRDEPATVATPRVRCRRQSRRSP